MLSATAMPIVSLRIAVYFFVNKFFAAAPAVFVLCVALHTVTYATACVLLLLLLFVVNVLFDCVCCVELCMCAMCCVGLSGVM